MATVTAGMTMSLDWYVADRSGSADRLYRSGRPARHRVHAVGDRETGAVVMGRRAFEMGDPDSYVGSYEFQVPIFVLTHHPPRVASKQDGRLTFTFVTDGPASAIRQAKAAAGDKVVQVVGGASVIQQLLRAGLVDELHVDVMPVLFGDGLRLFEHVQEAGIRLEKIDVKEVGALTSLANPRR